MSIDQIIDGFKGLTAEQQTAVGTCVAAIAAVLSALVAITAAVLVPLLSYWFTVRQERKKATAANKKEWIALVRGPLARLIAQGGAAATHELLTKDAQTVESMTVTAKNIHDFTVLQAEIDLLLNAADPQHVQLSDLMKKLRVQVGNAEMRVVNEDGVSPVGATCREIVKTARVIFKEEWERAKAAL